MVSGAWVRAQAWGRNSVSLPAARTRFVRCRSSPYVHFVPLNVCAMYDGQTAASTERRYALNGPEQQSTERKYDWAARSWLKATQYRMPISRVSTLVEALVTATSPVTAPTAGSMNGRTIWRMPSDAISVS